MKHDYAPGPWSVSGKTVRSICHQRHYAVARVDNKLFTEVANKANAVLIASSPELIDEVIIDDAGIQRGLYSGETIDQIALRYDNPQICDADEYIDMQENMLRTVPVSITEDRFQKMLEVLPPVDWRSVSGVTSFKMSERLSGCMTAIYAQKGNRFWTFTDVCSMSAERIAEIINALDEVKS